VNKRARARSLGIANGVLPTGKENSITDVPGVRVGQITLVEGEGIRTGATAILPHGGHLFRDKVPAGLSVGNGYGKLTGISQIIELGEIETPIILTNTLAVPNAVEAILDWTLSQPGNENVRSVNPVVGETNDGFLNDIRIRAISANYVLEAIENARAGIVEEGNVGAGTGTIAFGWKGGIGTSSRMVEVNSEFYTVGALVQSNFGGNLQILGAPVGSDLGQAYSPDAYPNIKGESIMIIVATDAPLSDRNLSRLAKRAMAGLARTGADMSNYSGDYALAFSNALSVRRTPQRRASLAALSEVPNDLMSPLFLAVIEVVEEAIYNSLFSATTMQGFQGNMVEALPIERVMEILKHHRFM
jgi:D-aminopeptidase